MASELTAWKELPALDEFARRWRPKRLWLLIFSAQGVRPQRPRPQLRIAPKWP